MGRILLVEDNAGIRHLFENFIQRLGLNCVVSSDGQEAIDILEKEKVDLIISDLRMPKIDGYKLKDFLKEKNMEIPLIVMSGEMLEGDDLKFFKDYQGFSGFLNKPTSLSKLKQCLESFF